MGAVRGCGKGGGAEHRRLVWRALLLVAVLSQAWNPAGANEDRLRPRYRLWVSIRDHQIEGRVEIDFANVSQRPVDEAVIVLFPNRFAAEDEGVNDFNRTYLYPHRDFDPGSMEIVEAGDAGHPVPTEPLTPRPACSACFVKLPLTPLPPGERRKISLRFRTIVPERFGSFGAFRGQLTLVGGWYPYLALLDSKGEWQIDAPPTRADFEVELSIPPGHEALLNGRHLHASDDPERVSMPSVHYLSLVTAPSFLRREVEAGGTRIVLLHRPPRFAVRWSSSPGALDTTLQALARMVSLQSERIGPKPAELIVIEAPLRLNLTAQGEGAVLISDRAFRLHRALRSFHELQLAQAVYDEMLRPRLAGREPPEDYRWVAEGLSRELAQRYLAQEQPGLRSVQDWIELFNIFAIVDRFESAPKIPFVEAFFERSRRVDPLGSEIATFNQVRPPGHVIFGKLREALGVKRFDSVLDRCLDTEIAFRPCLTATIDDASLFEQWLQPYPSLNYRFEDLRLNQAAANPDGRPLHYRHTLTIRRESSRAVAEPVRLRLQGFGAATDLRWDGEGETGALSAETSSKVRQAVIDPERKLIEDRRDDNFRPFSPQVVLDTAEVEVSSTEFGFSALMVGRARYDYRKDMAVAGFFTNRSVGAAIGPRWHWGKQIDPTLYRHNLYAFYGFQSLDDDFTQADRPARRTPGQLASLGLRYDYSNVFHFDHPTHQRQLRLFADWYDTSLGGDYDYADWGFIVSGTHPVRSHGTIAAAQLLNGFSHALGGGIVPNQGRFSLGGSRSIRGIGAEEELARNILLVRAELRQDVYPEVDLNLFDVLVLRRGQLRFFVDAGRVSDSAGRVYDVPDYAVGVGVGLAGGYEFLGFFPATVYVELATRADDPSERDEVQFLFGTRQAF